MSNDNKPPTPPAPPRSDDWDELARKASVEPDGAKLTQIVQQLCDSIDRDLAKKQPLPGKPDGNARTG